jgi:hypothetical protein
VVIPDESPESRTAVLVEPKDTWIFEEQTETVLRLLSGALSMPLGGAGRTDTDDPTPAPTSFQEVSKTSAPTEVAPSPSTIAPITPAPDTPAPIYTSTDC